MYIHNVIEADNQSKGEHETEPDPVLKNGSFNVWSGVQRLGNYSLVSNIYIISSHVTVRVVHERFFLIWDSVRISEVHSLEAKILH